MYKRRNPDQVIFAVSPESAISELANIYLQSLLWLTPQNPFGTLESTALTFSFGGSGTYTIYDPESSVDQLSAADWNQTIGLEVASYTAPNGDVFNLNGLKGEQASVYIAFQAWTAATNITISETDNFEDANFKLLVTSDSAMRAFWSGERGILAFAELPNNYGPNYLIDDSNYSAGFAAFDQGGYGWTSSALTPGGYGYTTILHELGHLFGLDHPWDEGGVYFVDGSTLPEPYFPNATSSTDRGDNNLNQGVYTAMSYNDGWKTQPSKGVDWGLEVGPGAFDIAAMQRLYGANAAYHDGADVYTLPAASKAGVGWFCLWDAGGADSIQAALSAGPCSIDLRAASLIEGDAGAGGYVSWVKGIPGGFTIAHGVTIENATGGNANDVLTGNAAGNLLVGNGGSDSFYGLAGDDILKGGAGADVLYGGAGFDCFVFDAAFGKSNIDKIQDFSVVEDTLWLSKMVFARLSGFSSLGADNFVIGAKARDWNDYIIYNTKTGAVFYDADGSGGGAAVQFASLAGVPALTYQDFVLF